MGGSSNLFKKGANNPFLFVIILVVSMTFFSCVRTAMAMAIFAMIASSLTGCASCDTETITKCGTTHASTVASNGVAKVKENCDATETYAKCLVDSNCCNDGTWEKTVKLVLSTYDLACTTLGHPLKTGC